MTSMATTLQTALAGCLISLALIGCGGGGGGDRAPGVEPGPTPPGGPVTPPPPILPSDSIDAALLTSSDNVQATVTGISFASPELRLGLRHRKWAGSCGPDCSFPASHRQ